MTIDSIVSELNSLITEENPPQFSSSWIYYRRPRIYAYIRRTCKNKLGDINWDYVVCRLDKPLQSLWIQPRPKRLKPYQDTDEVTTILEEYQPKLYVFISALTEEDLLLRDTISVALVRVAQKGNIEARLKLITLLMYLVDQWIVHFRPFYKWQGYRGDIFTVLDRCIRRYRFTGTFIGYLYKSMEYCSKGLIPTHSLDANIGYTDRKFMDKVIQDEETNQAKLY